MNERDFLCRFTYALKPPTINVPSKSEAISCTRLKSNVLVGAMENNGWEKERERKRKKKENAVCVCVCVCSR